MALAESMLVGINKQFQKALDNAYVAKTLSADAKKFVRKHDWPGNVRELRNVLIQSAVMSIEKTITEQDIAAAISQLPSLRMGSGEADKQLGDGFNLDEHLNELRKQYLIRAIHQTSGVKNKAAELLGFNSHQVLTNQLIRYGLETKRKKTTRKPQS